MRSHRMHLLPNVGLQICKGVKPGWNRSSHSGAALQSFAQLVLLKRCHAAIGVVDDDEFLRTRQMVRDDQRSQDIVGHDAARISDDVGIAELEPERLLYI